MRDKLARASTNVTLFMADLSMSPLKNSANEVLVERPARGLKVEAANKDVLMRSGTSAALCRRHKTKTFKPRKIGE